jgi:curli production assembly/transport component CsgG
VPIERENIGNLLQERNLIRSTRQEYTKDADPSVPQITPLLYAGILLEGGIAYDSNIITVVLVVGILVQEELSIQTGQSNHLPRMVSTSNGKILKSVYISKTILSQAIDQSLLSKF